MRRYANRTETQRERLDQSVHLNGYETIYGHFRFVQALRGVCGFRPNWAAYEPLEWPKVALDGLRRKVVGSVPIKWARNERSCLISFRPILAQHEELAVPHGRVRLLPFEVVDGRIILDLQEWELDASEPAKRAAAARARWARLSAAEKQELMERALAKQRKKWLAGIPQHLIKK